MRLDRRRDGEALAGGEPLTDIRYAPRGALREGFAADIVVFNPENVQDTATFERPHQFALGMDYVMVNGILVQQDGVPTEERPGLVLRR